MSDTPLREALLDAARRMAADGLNRGASGNLSVRVAHGFLITPSGLDYDEMTPDDLVQMNLDGTWRGPRPPSSEWRFHRDILATHPELGAVVHTHSTFATTLACLSITVPAFHYMIAVAGGKDIRCAPYATFGTQRLSDHALAALQGRHACLLAHHGMIATGPTLKAAADLAYEVEALCEQYWRAYQLGTPPCLSDEEMDIVLEKFKDYRRRA
ncbi:MAG: class II aldolase/adducin family protein [Betaproteobacteria bacterium]|nr:class II aldolase/adducin family protein [Betaproteobacteria bacterium]